MFDPNIKAQLVYDGTTLNIPTEMGTPQPDQLQGTPLENISELCCRVCYDSLGKGRSTEKMHEHLLDVKHWSVYEHAHFTLESEMPSSAKLGSSIYFSLLNHPEIKVHIPIDDSKLHGSSGRLHVTLNFRHLLDWDRFTQGAAYATANVLFNRFLDAARPMAPSILARVGSIPYDDPFMVRANDPSSEHYVPVFKVVPPELPEEKHVTLFLSGSRGMSHEQVRHRFNISQRSTRYVDEDKSPYVQHPLISRYLAECEGVPQADGGPYCVRNVTADSVDKDRVAYKYLTEKLQAWLIGKNVDKFTARKQARGAARNYLGNGLLTELMFTANITSWIDMLRLRCNPAADGEIRVMYGQVLAELKKSQYGDYFSDLELVPSPDGIGQVLKQ